MHVGIEDATAQLDELVDRALAGEDIVLIDDGRPAVRLSPVALDTGQSNAETPAS